MLFLMSIMNLIILMMLVLVSISFFTLFERKLLSYIQHRKGPNKVGIIGLFQAISDGVKLFSKEYLMFLEMVNLLYFISPILMFLLSFLLWIFFPYFYYLISFDNVMLLIFCLLSMNVYPLMFSGVFSNSIYSMIGGIRSVSQTISYEVSFILLIFSLLVMIETFDMLMFMKYSSSLMLIMFMLFVILYASIMAELNRTPFDFSEGESELISGYNIEYSSSGFALIFLSEYGNIMFLNLIFVLMFISSENYFYIYMNWLWWLYMVIMLRAMLPRMRYDKLMYMVWLNYLPISLNYIMFMLMLKYWLWF